jgi:hypothetical protein
MSLLSAVTQKEVLDSIKVDIAKGQTIKLSGKVDLQYLPATVYVILAGYATSTAAIMQKHVIYSAWGITRSPFDYIFQYTFNADFDGYINLVARCSDVNVIKSGYLSLVEMNMDLIKTKDESIQS